MSLFPAIKSADNGKPGAAGAEGGDISHGDDNGNENHFLFLRDVTDDLILCSHTRLPNLFYLCGCCCVCSLVKGCRWVQISSFIESHTDDVILEREGTIFICVTASLPSTDMDHFSHADPGLTSYPGCIVATQHGAPAR